MNLNGTEIVDTFAEAFPVTGARIIVTAATNRWCETAAHVSTGYATSVIGCDCEAGIERFLDAAETPDGRPGVSLLFFGFSRDKLQSALVNRVGQCLLTCPTTACYNGLLESDKDRRIRIGGQLRYFGDTFQISKKLGSRRFWRIPTMDGEFLCEDRFGTVKAVGGGNLLVVGTSQQTALAAAERAVAAIGEVEGVALPFPGGMVRAGSKVGSRYPKLKASTNDAYCPTLRPLVESKLPADAQAVYEIVIDGLTLEAVVEATRAGVRAASGEGVLQITAGNYGGKLGPHHIHLRKILAE